MVRILVMVVMQIVHIELVGVKIITLTKKKEINKNHSYKQVFKYLSKYKKVRIKEGGDWLDATMLKYIEDIVQKLNV